MRALLLAALALGATACAQNSILELEIALAARPPSLPMASAPCSAASQCPDEGASWQCTAGRCEYVGPWYGVVEVVNGDQLDFTSGGVREVWAASSFEGEALETMPHFYCLSAIGSSSVGRVNMRVRYCHDPHCVALADQMSPEENYTLEHPFYTGRRTYFRTYAAPADAPPVPQCNTAADCSGMPCVQGVCGCNTNDDCRGDPISPADDLDECVLGECKRIVTACHVAGCLSGQLPTRDGDWCVGEGASASHACLSPYGPNVDLPSACPRE